MNREIAEIKNVIRQNLNESKESLQIQMAKAQGLLSSDQRVISRYPTQEKVFRSIDRQQKLKEQLYLYLLQKREENAITLAVTAPKSKVVNPAFTIGPIKPKPALIRNGALAAGFLLPLGIFVLASLLDSKVKTKQQIAAAIPNATVIAEIPKQDQDYLLIQNNDFDKGFYKSCSVAIKLFPNCFNGQQSYFETFVFNG